MFLQQIGRGLRLADDKDCLTILDFIGQANSHFRFDLLYRGLVGGTRRELVAQVEKGFPFLPSGCAIQLDRVAQKIILDNLRQQLKLSRKQLIQELRAVGPHASLAEFLERSGQELSDIYGRSEPGWMALRRAAGFETGEAIAEEAPLLRAVSRMLHIDSADRLEFYQKYLDQASPGVPEDERERRLLEMLRFSLWTGNDAVAHSPRDLWEVAAVREELRELLPVLTDRVDHLEYRVDVHPEVPLAAHCHYSLAEILAAFGVMNEERPHQLREGVYFHEPRGKQLFAPDAGGSNGCCPPSACGIAKQCRPRSGCDLFFVTINKSERDYSPSTMYKDYAISPTLFHWQSQNSTRENSPTGLRYRSHRLGGTHALLFVRERKKDGNRGTAPYLYLGPAGYVSHEGERPMGIVWELRCTIPMVFYRGMRVAA